MPSWVGNTGAAGSQSGHAEAPEPPPEAAHLQWRTHIALPLKPAVAPEAVACMLDELHPSLLHFLRNLRCIAVRGCPGAPGRVLRRRDCGGGVVEVSAASPAGPAAASRYLLVSRELALGGFKRLDVAVDQTTVAAAFPLECAQAGGRPPQQSVFAFLPLRSYGDRALSAPIRPGHSMSPAAPSHFIYPAKAVQPPSLAEAEAAAASAVQKGATRAIAAGI